MGFKLTRSIGANKKNEMFKGLKIAVLKDSQSEITSKERMIQLNQSRGINSNDI